VERLTGGAVADWFEDLARLRITVFREFPYLYDGGLDYERSYLRNYAETDGSLIVGVFDGEQLVGASTGLPMEAEPDYLKRPLLEHGLDISRLFYFGESILLPEYRGRGTGKLFFDEREAHARALGGFEQTCFCAVIRPENHPRRPAGYQTLDAFWRRRGYEPLPGVAVEFTWRDLDEERESPKPMSVRVHSL
jgi:GNAT superfamily N-acetyltransferase